jgi:hypothetical protein
VCDSSVRHSMHHRVQRRSWATTYLLVGPHYRVEILRYKIQESSARKDVGPTRGFAATSEVGPGATVSTLPTGYPCIQALNQDKGQDMCPHALMCPLHRVMPPSTGSSGAATPPVVSAPAPWLRAALEPLRVHGSNTRHLA